MNNQVSLDISSTQKLEIEEFDQESDSRFVNDLLIPYFKDIYSDLTLRCLSSQAIQQQKLDKVTFIEYINMPGILADRVYKTFADPEDGLISEASFIENLIRIFISDLESRMRLTFNMYDFNEDGFIDKEDVRILLSYIPFQRDASSHKIQKLGNNETIDQNNNITTYLNNKLPHKEGLYLETEGKGSSYSNRTSDQVEINDFTDQVFSQSNNMMSYQEYERVNNSISSEMFYSIMMTLHERLPCSQNFFRLKKIYRSKMCLGLGPCKSYSPHRTIASPTIVKGLAIASQFSSPKARQQPMTTILNINMKSKQQFKQKIIINQKQSIFSKQCLDFTGQVASYGYEQDLDTTSSIKSHEKEALKPLQSTMKFNFMTPDIIAANGTHQRVPSLVSAKTNFMSIRNKKVYSPCGSPGSPGMSSVVRTNITLKNPTKVSDQSLQGLKLPAMNLNNQLTKKNITAPVQKSTFSKKSSQTSNFSSTAQSTNIGDFESNREMSEGIIEEQELVVEEEARLIENFSKEQVDLKYVFKEGPCYVKTVSNKIRKYWMVIMGNELYVYKSQDDMRHKLMHCLIGTFIKILDKEQFQNGKSNLHLWPLSLVIPPSKSRSFYFLTKADQQKWYKTIQEAIGYANLFDFYTLQEFIGQGQFGTIRLATHKTTQQKVAIKQVKKKDMQSVEVFQQRREIEVLKMCQHPNIIKLIDLFENFDNYFIVLEYMQGKDLYDYMLNREFNITEDRARQIILQIAKALKYLHSYGIVHRDLKLENILMSDTSEESIPKIVDFGLSKIIGPCEKSNETFGTIGYIAPEVLQKLPYSFSCDLWSLGVITFAILSGFLPFDHDDKRQIIQQTLNSPLTFEQPCWSHISVDAQDFIKGLLTKDPQARLTLDQALNHSWLLTQTNLI